MKRKSNLLAALGLLLTATSLHALNSDEWKFRQSLSLDATGPVKFSLPLATLDAAQPDLRDLRIVGTDGKEVPYLLLRPKAEDGQSVVAANFRDELSDTSTVLTFATSSTQSLESVSLETSARTFLKAVQIELSNDGQTWEVLAKGVPLFRQDGAEKTSFSLEHRRAAFVRLTLNDERSRPIVVTAATLRVASAQPTLTEPLTVRIVRTEEFAGETVVTLDLGAAHLSLASLNIVAEDPLFTRNISVGVRELRDGQIAERLLAQGTIYRIAWEGLAPAASLSLPVQTSIPGRELVVHIKNGDSPALHLREIQAQRNPVHVFVAPAASSSFEILTGNPLAAAPHYDLAALSTELNQLPLASVRIGEITTNTAYHQADPLAGLNFEGAAIDTTSWKNHRIVAITGPGVQQIELDLPALAATRADLSDVRLVQSAKQLPYIFERVGLSRDLTLTAVAASDAQRPSVSRWKISLPQSGLPLSRLSLSSPTRLFERRIHVYETLTNERGESYQRPLASAAWTRTPEDNSGTLSLTLVDRLVSDTLWIETDNGDNPPIALERVQAYYPVVRLLSKITSTQPVELIYGNASAAAPRYDIGLIAGQLLTAERLPATLGIAKTAAPANGFLQGARGGVLFWAALALVVLLLLVVVAKLLPKPNN